MKGIDFSYVGLELDGEGKDAMFTLLSDFYNELGDFNARFIGHHSTIAISSRITPQLYQYCLEHTGDIYDIRVLGVGYSDKAIAAKCEYDCPSMNQIKHITIAVNTSNDGRPKDSNQIQNWFKIQPFTIKGRLKFFGRK